METVLVDRAGGVVTVTMNRPHRKNAGTPRMWSELARAFRDAGADPEDRVLVLTGAGGAFCSGADLAGVEGDPVEYMDNAAESARALHALPIPTIAKVDGAAVGAGWNLALGCDLVVATERARFSQIFVRRALSVDMGGSWLLPRLVGLQKAKELTFFGDMLSAAEAHDLGLVTRVVAPADLDTVVSDLATRLAHAPAQALSLTKCLLDSSAEGGVSMEQALRHESHVQALNMVGDDAVEARDAFTEHREPVFFRTHVSDTSGPLGGSGSGSTPTTR